MKTRLDTKQLHDALRQMGRKELKREYREFWTPERPTTGFCYVVAEVVYHYLAPKESRPCVIKFEDDGSHWFVRDPAGNVIDLTADQFDEPVDYSQGKPRNFMTKTISRRGRKLAALLGFSDDA